MFVSVRKVMAALGGCGALLFTAFDAQAHVDVVGPGFADERQIVKFTVGHGCEGADTVAFEVRIPEQVTSLRALPGSFGEAQVVKTGDRVTSVIWTKPDARAADDHFYEGSIRIAVPDAPFTTIYFPSIQTCRTAAGEDKLAEWTALPGEEGEPAPALHILPVRKPGWNKYTVPVALTDLKVFDDAEIVWAGTAAYSGNPTTLEQIRGTDGVSELTKISAGAEIWVKY